MITGNEFYEIISDYWKISDCIKTCSLDEIVASVSENTGIDPQSLCSYPVGCSSRELEKGYSWYFLALKDLKENIDRYDWLYNRLYDDESRKVFRLLVAFRFFPDIKFIQNAYDGKHSQYFDPGIVNCDKNEVFVDCGGYIGDTAQSYVNVYGDYKKYYIYEPSKENVEKIKENLKGFHDVIVRPAGVGEKTDTVLFSQHGSSGSFCDGNWTDEGESTGIVSLDDDIKEPVTYIKMDIEGFEIPAIIGAKDHIVHDKPKMAICLYHILSDMWEIPMLVDSLLPDHRFYIRHYMEDQNWETVLYAIPPEKKRRNALKTTATTYSFPDRPWSNAQLVKDCGLIPYLLHKNYGMDAVMFGTSDKIEDYPYAKYVDGLRLVSLGSYDHETKIRYIAENAKDIDLLILYGGFMISAVFARVYKDNNPNGLIYCGLDANSGWMDRLPWYKPEYQWFIKNCDVMATSCTSMAEFLTKKWNRKIEVAMNGHYDLFGMNLSDCSFKNKENVIFTASRLGTPQKATEILINAFAGIADKIPDWTLRLAGSVQSEFDAVVGKFYLDHPELKDRVIFLGEITDKKQLADEYKKAKIFALPSLWEGGAPNVIGEALLAGCVTAVGYIDAWEDCIDSGRCGKVANAKNSADYAECLLELCNSEHLEEMSKRAKEYAKEKFDMVKIVDDIYDKLSEFCIK